MPKLPISFDDPIADDQALADYQAKLPVEMPQQLVGIDAANAVNNLFAPVNGVPRYQTWPEQMARSGATLPLETYQGKVPTSLGLRREDFTDIPQDQQPSNTWLGGKLGMRESPELGPSGELISRAQDMAGMAGGGSVAGVEKGAVGTLGGDLIRNEPKFDMLAAQRQHHQNMVRSDTAEPGAAVAALERAPVFYSAVEKAVKEAKQPSASADQWLGYLRNQPGVKQEELDWVLHDLPQGKITKSELEQYVQEHKVELKEVSKGQAELNIVPNEEEPHILQVYRADDPTGEHSGMVGEIIKLTRGNENKYSVNVPELRRKAFDTQKEAEDYIKQNTDIGATTKYHSYQLPGAENYREQLLTLPKKENANRANALNYIEDLRNKYGNDYRGKMNIDEARELKSKWDKVNADDQTLDYKSSHWDEPNVLAHIRTNERNIPGVGNSLHIEEIQSDWHQAGRKQGYKGELNELQPKFDAIEKKIVDSGDEKVMSHPELSDALKMAVDKKIITADEAKIYRRYSDISASGSTGGVPDAPLKTNWSDLALKRVIRQAAEQGKDSISWTPGEAQASRYQLSNHIDKIHFIKTDKGILIAPEKIGGGEVPMNRGLPIPENELATYIGKEVTEKIIERANNPPKRPDRLPEGYEVIRDRNNKEGEFGIIPPGQSHARSLVGWHNTESEAIRQAINHIHSEQMQKHGTLENLDLKVGGEGMKAFYDKMLVDKANAIAKKFGGKVEQAELASSSKVSKDQQSWEVYGRPYKDLTDKQKLSVDNDVKELTKSQPVHVLRITPQLRDAALNKGFSLFADTGKVGAPLAALTKVDHNPFTHTVTPVEHNPFTVDTYHGTPGEWKSNRIKPISGVEVRNEDGVFKVYDQIGRKYLTKTEFPTKDAAHDWIDKKGLADFYSTPNPSLASDYATQSRAGNGANILPLKINVKDYHTVDAKGATWDAVNQFAVNEANQLDKKGVIIHNVLDDANPLHNSRGPQTVYITLDPSTVRSRFAKFDPAKFHESGLMKASGLPIITDKDGKQLDHNLKPLTVDEQNALLDRNPLPTHKGPDGKAIPMPSKTALGLAAMKASEYVLWAARPSLGPALWTSSILGGAVMNAAPKKELKEGRPLGGYRLVPVAHDPFAR